MNRDQVPSAVDFSVNIFVAQTSFDSDWNVGFDVTIACVQIYVGGKATRQFESDAAIASVKGPARSNRRPGQRPRFNAAVSSGQIESVESSGSGDVTIPGARPQRAIYRVDILMAVAGLQIHLTFQIRQPDGAVPSMQIDLPSRGIWISTSTW